MRSRSSPSARVDGLMACLFVTALSAYLALPSLLDAWRHDPYSSGGFLAWLAWLGSLGIISCRWRGTCTGHAMVWIVCSAVLCALGSMVSLRVCHHLAFVCALCGIAAPLPRAGWLAVVGGLSWLPASGWCISGMLKGGLTGWERPALAVAVGLLLSVAFKPRSSPSIA